jgi:D-glycero-alpha-D-manno-heptose-7-phosphate kinase
MIITRAPFRIPLGGGGTDLPSYYREHGGFLFSAGIDKYMYICVNQPIVDDLVRMKYSQTEIVNTVDEVQHELAREALRLLGFKNAIEIVSMADVPAGTGLGSSSCYLVGLLQALHTLKRDFVPLQALAEEACRIELETLGRPIGKQDQYLAAFGGLSVLDIARDGAVTVRNARVSRATIDDLEKNMLIFYTGQTRSTLDILAGQSRATEEKDPTVVESLHRIKAIGYRILEAFEAGDLTRFGQLLDEHWESKKRLSSKVSDPRLDGLYRLARENGALGGKITGAGGGGFFVFYCEDGAARLRRAMAQEGLREMRYRIDFEGTKVISNFLNYRIER